VRLLKYISAKRSINVWIGMWMIMAMPFISSAQTWPFELWHEGKLVLLEGDTLRGMIKYDLQQDLVQYTFRDQQPEAYTARKVLFFEIYDTSVNRYRRFFTLPYATSPGYKTPIFFELLEEGKLTLLSREFLEFRTQTSMYTTYSRQVLSNRYFFLNENGDITEFTGGKGELLDLLGKNDRDDVEKFMRKNRLILEDKYDFMRIVDYYNSLHGM
jgi:hypothetical protein